MDDMNNNSDIEMLKSQMKAVLAAIGEIRAELEGKAMEEDGDLEWMAYVNSRINRLEEMVIEDDGLELMSDVNDRLIRLEDDMDYNDFTVLNLIGRVNNLEDRLDDVVDEFPADIATQIEDLYAEREMIWDNSRDYAGGLLTIEDVERIEEINKELEELECLGTNGVTVVNLEDDDVIQDIEEDLDQVYGDVYVMGKDVHGLRMQVESHRDELNTVFKTIENQEDEIALLQDRVADFNGFSRDDVAELRDSVSALERRADAVSDSFSEGSIATLQETVAGLESAVEDLESKVYDIDELSSRVDDLEELEYRLDNLENGGTTEGSTSLEELMNELSNLERSTPSLRDFEGLLERVDALEADKPEWLTRRLEGLETSRDYEREDLERNLDEIINDLIDLRIWKRELEAKSLGARLRRAYAAVSRFFPRISWKGNR
jgi:uncharacterized protein YoxC